jgi:adhesin HecA-like repeat protein
MQLAIAGRTEGGKDMIDHRVTTARRLFGLLLLAGGFVHAQAVITVEPASQDVSQGTEFNVDVNISGVADLYGYQFDLTFNPAVLSEVSTSEGSFLAGNGNATFFIGGTIDNGNGVVSATADTLLSAVAGTSGAGTLAVFTFDAKGKGASSIGVSGIELLDSSFNAIDAKAAGGTVEVGTSSVSAPEIDPRRAFGALALLLGSLAARCGRQWGAGK